MKLRRALATAAATAVIAPAALLAAPAAYADETPAQPEATATGSAPAAPDPETGGSTDENNDEDNEETPGDGDGSEDTDGTDGTDGTEDAGSPAPGTEDGTGDDSADQSAGDEQKPGDEEGKEGEEGEEQTDVCTIDATDLQVTVANLPSKLVAGGGWSNFSVHLENTTDETLDQVFPILYATPTGDVENPAEVLEMQYQNPETGKWTSFDEWTDYSYFGYFTLDAHQTAELPLRIRADKDAQDGDGFALIAGDYYKEDGSCGWSEEAWYDFTILAAGSDLGEVPPAKPGKPGDKDRDQADDKTGDKTKPQGGLEELPVKGNLAETGSSSMLPTLAVVGGVAMVAGAGAIFVVRRRKAGDLGATA